MVKPILDGPMGADHAIELRRGKLLIAQVIGRLLSACPLFELGAETFRLAVHPHEGLKMIMPRLCAYPGRQWPDLGGALLDAMTLAQVTGIGFFEGRLTLRVFNPTGLE